MSISTHRAIGLFSNRSDAEMALTKLSESGFDMNRVSVLNKNSDAEGMEVAAVAPEETSNAKAGASTGAALGGVGGGILGLAAGLAVLAIPGAGPVAAVATVLANTALGGVLGAAGGSLFGALVGWGIPEDRAQYYSDRVYNEGNYLIIVEGNAAEIETGHAIFAANRVSDWQVFPISNSAATMQAAVDPTMPPTTGRAVI